MLQELCFRGWHDNKTSDQTSPRVLNALKWFGNRWKAVSYTHLDVYKRQGLHILQPALPMTTDT